MFAEGEAVPTSELRSSALQPSLGESRPRGTQCRPEEAGGQRELTPVASHPVPKGWRGQAGCWWLPFSVLLGARRPVSPFPPCTLRHLPPQGNPGHYALFCGIKMRAEGKGALQVSVVSGTWELSPVRWCTTLRRTPPSTPGKFGAQRRHRKAFGRTWGLEVKRGVAAAPTCDIVEN